MVDYQQLKTSDTSALRELSKAWTTTIKELTTTSDTLEDHVWRPLMSGEVNGHTIDAASWRSKNFATQIDNGATEATNLRTAIDDHADGIDALRRRLNTLETEIQTSPELRLLSDGTVVYEALPGDFDKETKHARHQSGTALAKDYTDRISALLKEANEHDSAMAADLTNIAELHHDGDVTFNDTADTVTSERAEAAADEAVDIMESADGKGLSPEDQARLNQLLWTYGDVPAFATKIVDDLGTKGLLELSGGIAIHDTGTKHTDVADFQKYLGQTLSTALNADPALADDFANDMKELGTRGFPYGGDVSVQGYQILGPLLENGHYPKDFLLSVNEDMIRLSASGHHWDTGYAGNPVDPVGESYADPFNYGLTALGHNPEASLEFFNSPHPPLTDESGNPPMVGEGENRRQVGYLGYVMSVCGEGSALDPTTVGRAVEAASTGLPYDAPPETPRVEHTPEMVDLTERVIDFVGDNPSAFDGSNVDKQDLVASLGDITINYIEDFHRGLSDPEMYGMPESHGEPLDFGAYDAKADANGNQQQIALKNYLQVLGHDPETFGKVWQVSNSMASSELSQAAFGSYDGGEMQTAMNNSLEPHSRMMIDLSLGQYNAIHDQHLSAVEAHNGWVAGATEGLKFVSTLGLGRLDPSGVVPTGVAYLFDGVSQNMTIDPSADIEADQRSFESEQSDQMRRELDGIVDTAMREPVVAARIADDGIVPDEIVDANVQLYDEVLSNTSTIGRK